MARALLVLLAWLAPTSALAQTILSHDGIAGDTNVTVTCGFCAQEKIGVVFRELPAPGDGLDPAELPIELVGVQLALANASVDDSRMCVSTTVSGVVDVSLEIWAGIVPPEGGELAAMPESGPWGGAENEMLLVDTVVPITLSTAASPSAVRYDAFFNELALVDEEGRGLRVESPYTYLRVLVTLESGTVSHPICTDEGLDPPNAFPMRDDDGVVAPNRSYLFAGGLGWVWGEDARVLLDGDWAIRVEYLAEGSPGGDGGMIDAGDAGTDANSDADASTDAEPSADADASTDADASPEPDADASSLSDASTDGDAGMRRDASADGSARPDAADARPDGARDAARADADAARPDGAPGPTDDGGCDCSVPATKRGAFSAIAMLGLVALLARRRRR